MACAGGSLLYTGGMFLNDACDSRFDAQFRPERPIPSGAISLQSVTTAGVCLLGSGLFLFALLGLIPGSFAAALVICIVLYNVLHKKSSFAPVLMASCRLLLYLATASAAATGVTRAVFLFASGVAIYIIGVSYIARVESTGARINYASLPLLLAPLIAAVGYHGSPDARELLVLAVFVAWLVWCVQPLFNTAARALAHAVPRLLAGIVLADLIAVQHSGTISLVFPILFAGTLTLQRFIPAT